MGIIEIHPQALHGGEYLCESNVQRVLKVGLIEKNQLLDNY